MYRLAMEHSQKAAAINAEILTINPWARPRLGEDLWEFDDEAEYMDPFTCRAGRADRSYHADATHKHRCARTAWP